MTIAVAIIDYGAGNLHSVEKALRHVASGTEAKVTLVREGRQIEHATHVILPGVGAFADCMAGLQSLPDMIPALEQAVRQDKKPFFGICVGMQMLFETSKEHGEHKGLSWIEGEVVSLKKEADRQSASHDTGAGALKIPHMGWNDLQFAREHAWRDGVNDGDHAYFVHSYHCVPREPSDVLATVDYGQTVVAAIQRGNIVATQFHPEKSQQTGLRMLKNFLSL